ncbi:MAG: hypothetical protein ACOYN0_09870, partial [Phycisphaerales bacterium]
MWRYAMTLIPLLAALCAGAACGQGERPEELLLRSGGVLRFVVKEPARADQSAPVPVLVALAPGKQSEEMAKIAFDRYYSALVAKGWVVVSPLARTDSTLLDDANSPLGELLDEVARRYTVEGGKVHLAGVSNGGRAAFRLALAAGKDKVASLLVLPGFAPSTEDTSRLGELAGVRVRMIVGENDSADWIDASRATLKALRDADVDASLVVRQGEGHVVKTTPEEIAAMMESFRPPP